MTGQSLRSLGGADGQCRLKGQHSQVGFPPSFSAIFDREMQKLPLLPCILLRNDGKPVSVDDGDRECNFTKESAAPNWP